MVFVGSLYEARTMWDLGDIGVGAMAWVNIIAILLLSPKAFKALRSYERQKKRARCPNSIPMKLVPTARISGENKGCFFVETFSGNVSTAHFFQQFQRLRDGLHLFDGQL